MSGKRETPATNTPLEYQLVYMKCWNEVPNKRPLIEDISKELDKLLLIQKKEDENKLTKSEKDIQELKNTSFNHQLSSQKLRVGIFSLSNEFNDSISNELEEIKNRAENKIQNCKSTH